MNIVIIAHYQDDGSPYVSFVHAQACAYRDFGMNVFVIAPVVIGKKYAYWDGIPYKEIDGIPVYYPHYFSVSNYGRYTFNNYSGFLAVKTALEKIRKNIAVDIIHAHTIGFDGWIANRLKKLYSIPVVITTHGTDTFGEIAAGKQEHLKNICMDCDAIVAVSTKLKRELTDNCKIQNVSVILNGFLRTRINNIEKNPYSILQVGALIPRKRVDITIQAFAKIVKKYPSASLVIIGKGTEEINLATLTRSLSIESKVKFTGHLSHEKVLSYMCKSHIFVMPSVKEGLGIVYLEAMGAGCVTIGTKNEGIEDVICDGKNGYLVESTVNALAKKMDFIFSQSESEKNTIIREAENTVQGLTWEKNAEQYLKLFGELVGG